MNPLEAMQYSAEMLGVLAASLLLAPPPGVIVIDRLAVAIVQLGNWKQMDNMYSKTWPRTTIPAEVVKSAASGHCFLLKDKTATEFKNPGLTFGGDDSAPGERGWTLADEIDAEIPVVWFGAKPVSPKYSVISNSSNIYSKVVLDYLKTKGLKKPSVKLHTVIQADLDGNGTQEVLIFAGSRKSDDMYTAFTGLQGGAKTEDFSLAMIRYVSGKTVKVAQIYYCDARKGGLDGHAVFAGLWDLDGKPGLEILHRWSGYEANSSTIAKFASGRYSKIAEAGDGV